MNQEELKKLGVSYEDGVHRFAGKAALYEKYLLKFPEDPNFAELKQAMENGDLPAAFRSAHALKGITGNLSLGKLYDQVQILVEALRRDDAAEAALLFSQMEATYHALDAALKT